MQYEVEQKFPAADLAAVEGRLAAVGGRFDEGVTQIDRYFAHPSRNFAATDEALRIRRVGDDNCITYKGPKLDAATKTRREIELAIQGGEVGLAQFTELLMSLGFSVVAEVCKRRRSAEFTFQGTPVCAALDDVAGVGTFVELEILADQSQLDAARKTLLELAAELGLSHAERRSYLELLLVGRQEKVAASRVAVGGG